MAWWVSADRFAKKRSSVRDGVGKKGVDVMLKFGRESVPKVELKFDSGLQGT
jgi:hypothetical protein